MPFTLVVGLLSLGIVIGRVILREVGRRMGRDPEGARAIDGAVFGLLGLLLAFTFSGTASRFDALRQLACFTRTRRGGHWGA